MLKLSTVMQSSCTCIGLVRLWMGNSSLPYDALESLFAWPFMLIGMSGFLL